MRVKHTFNRGMVIANSLFVLCCLAALLSCWYCTRVLDSQYAYERWQGDGTLKFTQVSCYLPADGKLALTDIYTFRTAMLSKFTEASIDTSNGYQFTDCWSTEGSGKVSGDRNDGTASIIAVGGNYFLFHPLHLVNGSYLTESDLMKDNVLLDEDLAWLLFGGDDLEGMTVYLFNMPFRIAGVVSREDDFASQKAYTGGLGLYMAYDTYIDLCGIETAGISCYEVCLPNPVQGYGLGVVQSKFPIGSGTIVENRGRFSIWNLLSIARDFAARSIHSGASYPYWENAARYAETRASLLLVIGIIFACGPVIVFVYYFSRNMVWSSRYMQEEVLPTARENTQEAIRKQQRKRWEKRTGYHERIQGDAQPDETQPEADNPYGDEAYSDDPYGEDSGGRSPAEDFPDEDDSYNR